jgi:hypothetical protein
MIRFDPVFLFNGLQRCKDIEAQNDTKKCLFMKHRSVYNSCFFNHIYINFYANLTIVTFLFFYLKAPHRCYRIMRLHNRDMHLIYYVVTRHKRFTSPMSMIKQKGLHLLDISVLFVS